MKVFALIAAALPVLAMAQEGAGSPNPLASIADNPAIAASSAASSGVSTASAAHNTTHMSGETTLPATRPSGTGLPPPASAATSAIVGPGGVNATVGGANETAGANGTNGTSGALAQVNSVPIAGWLAAAGLVGAAVLG